MEHIYIYVCSTKMHIGAHFLYQLFQYFCNVYCTVVLVYCILILKRRGRVLKYLLFYAQVAPVYDRRSKQSKRLLIFSKRRKTHSMLCTPLRHVVKATSNIYVVSSMLLCLIHIPTYISTPETQFSEIGCQTHFVH